MTKRILLGLLAIGLCLPVLASNPYKYSLNANHAEEILAGIKFGPRLLDADWRNKLGDLYQELHTVKQGDTLWQISQRALNDPWLWRKIWQTNPTIENPHLITPGQILTYILY